MNDFAKKYIEFYESLGKWAKVILCLLWDIPSNLYRFSKSALKDNVLGMILAVVLAIFGGWVLFVIDALCLILKDKIYWLDDLSEITNSDTVQGTVVDDATDTDSKEK